MTGSRIEVGHVSLAPVSTAAQQAQDDEGLGFDVEYFGDNQILRPDVFQQLRDAVAATSTIRLATGVTNMVTRHPSVIASTMWSLQYFSGGRMVCGVGRGDSALAMVGQSPQGTAQFARDLDLLADYLRGDAGGGLRWIHDQVAELPCPPLQVMATGPKTLALAGRVADRVTVAVGADPRRVAWARDVALDAAAAFGRDRADVGVGAFVQVAIDGVRDEAIARLRGRVKAVAHYHAFAGAPTGPEAARIRTGSEPVATAYDYAHHDIVRDNPIAQAVPPDFAEWFGIPGDTDEVIERLGRLVELGLDHLMIGALPDEERRRFAAVVIPALPNRTPADQRS